MEAHQFDEFVRSLSRSRRAFLGLGVTLGISPLLADAKRHKKKKKKKKKCLDFADGECQSFGDLCNPYGSPCCNCVPCVPQALDMDDSVIYRCIKTSPDGSDD